MTAMPATSDKTASDSTNTPPSDRVCARLSEILRDGADVHRTVAAQALGTIGRLDAVPALLDALLDEDSDVRVDAATALGRIGDPSTAAKLMDNLIGDPCAEVKIAALDALIAMRHEAVVPWLVRLLKGRDEEMAWDEDEIYQDGWDDWIDIQVKAIEGLAAFGVADAVPDVVAAIEDEFGQDLSEKGFRALARMGEPGLAALIGYLDGKDIRLRRRAVAMLAMSDAPSAQEAVGRALKAKSTELRAATLRAVASRNPKDPRLAELFVARQTEIRAETIRLCGRLYPARVAILLQDSNWDVQKAALGLMAEAPKLFNGDELAELLRRRLQSESVAVGAAALKAVGAVLGEDALPDVLGVLTDRDIPLARRLAAVAALGTIGGEHAIAGFNAVLGGDERQIRLDSMAQLATLARDAEWPNPAGYALLAALHGELVPEPEESEEEPEESEEEPEESEKEEEAAESEAAGGDEETAPAEDAPAEDAPAADIIPTSTLQAILEGHEDEVERIASAEPELTETDEAFLDISRRRAMRKSKVSPNPKVAPHQDVRRFSARVLGEVVHADVAVALAEAVSDKDEEVRLAAADSLVQLAAKLEALPEPAADAIAAAAGSETRDMRLAAVRALVAAAQDGAEQLFRDRLADEDDFVRAEAIHGLTYSASDTARIAEFLTDGTPGVREAAAAAVAASGDADALGLLVDFAFFREGFHKERAARLLRGMDAATASDRFLDVLQDEDRMRVWLIAMVALAELNRPSTDTAPPDGGPENRRIEIS